ncbi:MAG TPA: response regulator [Gemmatimonadales bacterium]|nr:response regulator [Gemmatimonadales bacterium]
MSDIPTPASRPIAVAIVDDEASVRTSLRRLCQALGFQPTVFASGRQFLESLAVAGTAPDCLVLDARMLEMTGLEVHEQMSRSGMHVPTIVLTADDAPEVKSRYTAAGVKAYLRKPVGGEELYNAIVHAVGLTERRN